LGVCLEKAGATYTAAEVLEEFAAAAGDGASVDEIIPLLFHDEPVVANEADARRLFSNLFGAWDEAAGMTPPTPAAQVEPGEPLPQAVVEASWRATDGLPPRELSAQWDRFTQTQSDLVTFLTGRCRSLQDEAFDTATTAAFEMWRAYAAVRGDLVKANPLDLRELERIAANPPTVEVEPALADFAAEALEIAEAEGLTQVADIAPLLAAIRQAMAGSWR
jgi:hypothetical protein